MHSIQSVFGTLCGRHVSDFKLVLLLPAGLSNIIGIIVYISSNTGDPSDKKEFEHKSQYSYGWSFYSGALSFIVAEAVGVLAVNMYIDRNKEAHMKARRDLLHKVSLSSSARPSCSSSSPYTRISSYRYRRRARSRSSSRSSEPSRDASPVGLKMPNSAAGGGVGGAGGGGGGASGSSTLPLDISMFTLGGAREHQHPLQGAMGPYSPHHRDHQAPPPPPPPPGFLQVHNCFPKDTLKDTLNRRTTPV